MIKDDFDEHIFDNVFKKIDLLKYVEEIGNSIEDEKDPNIFLTKLFNKIIEKSIELEKEMRKNFIENDISWPPNDEVENLYIIRPEYLLWATTLLTCCWTSNIWDKKSFEKIHPEEYRKSASKVLPYIKPSIDLAYMNLKTPNNNSFK